jgi:hypothetical protein
MKGQATRGSCMAMGSGKVGGRQGGEGAAPKPPEQRFGATSRSRPDQQTSEASWAG